MTVAELISKLQTLPQSAVVLMSVLEFGADVPNEIGVTHAVKAAVRQPYCGQYLCDSDPARLVERVSCCPEYPDKPEVLQVVFLGRAEEDGCHELGTGAHAGA